MSEALARGYSVVALDTRKGKTVEGVTWSTGDLTAGIDPAVMAGAAGVIHLAGQPIFGRWTPAFMQGIRESRVAGTRAVVEAMSRAEGRPAVLVSASAMGYYGDAGERELEETDAPGSDFLASVCMEWEAEASAAAHHGVRVVSLRTAHVLGKGGILRELERTFRLFMGGWFGKGSQWMSWIEVSDLARLYLDAIEDDRYRGPVNAASPEPVSQRQFMKAVGHALGRPAWLRIPSFPVRVVYGDFTDVFLGSQRLVPRRALLLGFAFRYRRLDDALGHIYEQETS
jgi:uncharacterized protein (TIGR01777 family)